MLYARSIAEKFLSTLILVFIPSCYFIYNARRDTPAEKELDIVIQMALEHLLVQRFKKKVTSNSYINVTKGENPSRTII